MGCVQSQYKPFRCENKNCQYVRLLQGLPSNQSTSDEQRFRSYSYTRKTPPKNRSTPRIKTETGRKLKGDYLQPETKRQGVKGRKPKDDCIYHKDISTQTDVAMDTDNLNRSRYVTANGNNNCININTNNQNEIKNTKNDLLNKSCYVTDQNSHSVTENDVLIETTITRSENKQSLRNDGRGNTSKAVDKSDVRRDVIDDNVATEAINDVLRSGNIINALFSNIDSYVDSIVDSTNYPNVDLNAASNGESNVGLNGDSNYDSNDSSVHGKEVVMDIVDSIGNETDDQITTNTRIANTSDIGDFSKVINHVPHDINRLPMRTETAMADGIAIVNFSSAESKINMEITNAVDTKHDVRVPSGDIADVMNDWTIRTLGLPVINDNITEKDIKVVNQLDKSMVAEPLVCKMMSNSGVEDAKNDWTMSVAGFRQEGNDITDEIVCLTSDSDNVMVKSVENTKENGCTITPNITEAYDDFKIENMIFSNEIDDLTFGTDSMTEVHHDIASKYTYTTSPMDDIIITITDAEGKVTEPDNGTKNRSSEIEQESVSNAGENTEKKGENVICNEGAMTSDAPLLTSVQPAKETVDPVARRNRPSGFVKPLKSNTGSILPTLSPASLILPNISFPGSSPQSPLSPTGSSSSPFTPDGKIQRPISPISPLSPSGFSRPPQSPFGFNRPPFNHTGYVRPLFNNSGSTRPPLSPAISEDFDVDSDDTNLPYCMADSLEDIVSLPIELENDYHAMLMRTRPKTLQLAKRQGADTLHIQASRPGCDTLQIPTSRRSSDTSPERTSQRSSDASEEDGNDVNVLHDPSDPDNTIADSDTKEESKNTQRIKKLSIPFSFPIIKEIEIEPESPDSSDYEEDKFHLSPNRHRQFRKCSSLTAKDNKPNSSGLSRFFKRQASTPCMSSGLDAFQLQRLQKLAEASKNKTDKADVISEDENPTAPSPRRLSVSVPFLQSIFNSKSSSQKPKTAPGSATSNYKAYTGGRDSDAYPTGRRRLSLSVPFLQNVFNPKNSKQKNAHVKKSSNNINTAQGSTVDIRIKESKYKSELGMEIYSDCRSNTPSDIKFKSNKIPSRRNSLPTLFVKENSKNSARNGEFAGVKQSTRLRKVTRRLKSSFEMLSGNGYTKDGNCLVIS